MSKLSVLVHRARLLDTDPDYCKSPGLLWFLVVTNLDDHPVVITHAWVESPDRDRTVYILDRKLPVRLRPEEQFVTFVADHLLLDHIPEPETAFRVFTSRQETFKSTKNTAIPPKGNS